MAFQKNVENSLKKMLEIKVGLRGHMIAWLVDITKPNMPNDETSILYCSCSVFVSYFRPDIKGISLT